MAAGAARLALGGETAGPDTSGLVAPAALAISHLGLYDVGTSIVTLFSVLVTKGLKVSRRTREGFRG